MSGFSGPLSGVKVLDLTTVFMGPFATQMLGDLGADVLKVEAPGGDSTRTLGPNGEHGLGPLFLGLNRNKRSIVIDLKSAAGAELLLELAKICGRACHQHPTRGDGAARPRIRAPQRS